MKFQFVMTLVRYVVSTALYLLVAPKKVKFNHFNKWSTVQDHWGLAFGGGGYACSSSKFWVDEDVRYLKWYIKEGRKNA